LVIGLDAGTADWPIFWLWCCTYDSLVVSSAMCMTGHCHTNLDSKITVRDIWCIKLGMVVC
jgi:hypothetical protein